MKEFKGEIFYRGSKLHLEFCSENLRSAAILLNQSKYQIKKHFTYELTTKSYTVIKTYAWDEDTAKILGTNLWMSLERAKHKINSK